MSDTVAVVIPETIPVAETTAEQIAEAVADKLEEGEDEEQWVRDLFENAINPLRESVAALTQQISAVLSRIPDQESYNRLQEILANLLQTKLVADSVTQSPTPEVIVIPDPMPEPITENLPEPVSAEDVEKAAKTEPQKKRRRL